jgi:hypothetical protein
MHMQVPNWLKGKEIDMTDDERIEPPQITTIPLPDKIVRHDPAPANKIEISPQDDVIIRAAQLRAEAEAHLKSWSEEKQRLTVLCTEATLSLEQRNKLIDQLRLDLLEKANNLQVLQAQHEELRQENSDLRAVLSSLKVQLDNYEIPLPIRQRAKRNGNEKKNEK